MSQNKDKSVLGLIIGAIVTAFLASTCCLGPLLFVLFGVSVSGLSFLHVFAPYRIYFTSASVLILTYLWINYFIQKRKQVCTRSTCKNYLKFLLVGTVLVLIMLIYPYLALGD